MPFDKQIKKGDCECCTVSIDVTLTYEIHGGMWQCDNCRQLDSDIKKSISSVKSINHTLTEAKRADESILIKQDIFNSKAPSAVEIKAAIMADESIPDSEKNLEYTKQVEARLLHFTDIVFSIKDQLQEAENARKMWLINTQEAASQLRSEQRALFAKHDINYKPVVKTIKSVKPGKSSPSVSSTSAGRNQIKEMAEKYKVSAPILTMMVVGDKTTSVESHARKLAETMASKSIASVESK
jgi:hypothetical protein